MDYTMGALAIEKFDILLTFFNMDILVDSQQKRFKFCLCVVHYGIEGTVSQIFELGLGFCFMNFRKLSFKK